MDLFEEDYTQLGEILRTPSIRQPILFRKNPLDVYPDFEVVRRFRFCKQSIQNLLEMLTDTNLTGVYNLKASDISPLLQLLVALRFYATGNFQLSNGDHHKISQQSVSKIIKNVSTSIASLRKKFINYPTFAEAGNVRSEFANIAEFEGVLGAIDCTHIKIISPGGANAELYRNRKGIFSINVQAVCDARLRFTNCVARWPGSVHDSRIFNSSLLRAQLGEAEVPGILLGDGGYPCLRFLMTPMENPQTAAEKRYNRAQIKLRNCIERAFGVLKRRFCCLKRELRTKLSTSLSVIVACFVLHNYAIHCNMDIEPFEDDEDINGEVEEPPQVIHSTCSGLAMRRTLIATQFTTSN